MNYLLSKYASCKLIGKGWNSNVYKVSRNLSSVNNFTNSADDPTDTRSDSVLDYFNHPNSNICNLNESIVKIEKYKPAKNQNINDKADNLINKADNLINNLNNYTDNSTNNANKSTNNINKATNNLINKADSLINNLENNTHDIYNATNITNTSDTYFRQLDFDKKVCKENPSMFTNIISHEIVDAEMIGVTEKIGNTTDDKRDNGTDGKRDNGTDGKYDSNIDDKRDSNIDDTKQPNNLLIITEIQPVLDSTLRKIRNELTITDKKECICALLKAVDIMHQNGFSHRDMHSENIMYKKISDTKQQNCKQNIKHQDTKFQNTNRSTKQNTNRKGITKQLYNKQTSKYQWYLIDYNAVHHLSYKPNETDILQDKFAYSNDKLAIVLLFLPSDAYRYIKKQNKEMLSFEIIAGRIRSSHIYKKIAHLIPNDRLLDSYGRWSQLHIDTFTTLITEILYFDDYLRLIGITAKIKRDESLIPLLRDVLLSI